MGNRGLDCGDAGAHDSFEWGSVYGTKQEGCEVVEMECSALAACASLRNVIWGCILFTADTLADVENYDERSWGNDSFAYALELCLDAVVKL